MIKNVLNIIFSVVLFAALNLNATPKVINKPASAKKMPSKAPVVKPAKTASLTLNISKIKPKKGSIRVILWNKKELFTKEGKKPYRYIIFPANEKTAWMRFDGLIPGEKVSIFIHQDLNGDRKVTSNLFGKPTDPYQFGNNSRRLLSKPKYEETLVTIGKNGTVHNLSF